MSTPDTVKAQIQSLIGSANAATGKTDADLTTAVNSLIAGYGQGGSAPVLEELTITQNGTYTPGNGVAGFSKVTANVSGGSGGNDPLVDTTITLASSLSGNSAVVYESEKLAGLGWYVMCLEKLSPSLSGGTYEGIMATRLSGFDSNMVRWTGTAYSGSHYGKYLDISTSGQVTLNSTGATLPWLAGDYRLRVFT